jgi:acetyl esterase/lipase
MNAGVLVIGALALASCALAEEPAAVTVRSNIAYRSGDGLDAYARQRCVLDLYLPATKPGFPVLLWFHGGGLEGGDKASGPTVAVAKRFAAAGMAVASVEYRLSPTVTAPAYIEDAAAAVAWVTSHIAADGGDARSVFISGHSAGGYLAALLGADPAWLAKAGVPSDAIAGIIPVSGQVFTHFTISKERGMPDAQHTPVIDAYAPIHFVARAKSMLPFLLLCGDHDWPGRAEENRCFAALLKAGGATDATYTEIADRDHGSILGKLPTADDPAAKAIIAFVTAHRRKP